MKYISFIIITAISIGCKNSPEDDCIYPDSNLFSVYKNKVLINLPTSILKRSDTTKSNFEYDDKLIFTTKLYTEDSLSSIYIKARDNSLSTQGFAEYTLEVENYYMDLFKYNKRDYSTRQIDTVSGRKLIKFIFLAKERNDDIAVGGLIFYFNSIRFEIIVKLDERNFFNVQKRIECIINSLKVIDN